MTPPKICYLIASAPRSGSHLLSTLMGSTGLAGRPEEHFNPWHMGLATNNFPHDLIIQPEYVQDLIEKTTTPNGVFGTKAQFTQVSNFVGMQRLESLFPIPLKYLYIQRKDNLRQAVSMARAIQSNRWTSDEVEQGELYYDDHIIGQCLREIAIQEKGWEMHFYQNRVEPFRIVYEDFFPDPAPVIRAALEWLEIEVPAGFDVPAPRLKKQADDLNEQWVKEYLSRRS